MARYHRDADAVVKTVTDAYDKASDDLLDEIKGIFDTFARNGELSPTSARRALNQRIPNPLLKWMKRIYPSIKNERVRRWFRNRFNAPAYRARVTRLEALRGSINIHSKVIADVELTATTNGYMRVISSAYYRSMFDLQKGLGVGFNFASVPTRTIETILKRPWSGENFSSRVWGNSEVLAKQLTEVLTAGFFSGSSYRKMRLDIEGRMGVGKHAANRLIRTETTYMSNAAEMEAYEEAEIDRYRFMATLDNRTSQICRQHDLKIYAVKDARPGTNMPPLHPYCRSTTIAYFGDVELDRIERRARDPETGKTYTVPDSMTYAQWKEKYAQAA
ncbi:minor capsid protein [Cohnella sp. GCM10020058]|uniref:minor capsid protein n=1 Tax=Cohnella sp. GCM10020058 TaxID=3317330 RepID=UPI0036318D8B